MPRAAEVPPAFASGSHDNYIVLERIGEGSFGKVYKGRRKHTGQTVALKFIGKHGKSERDLRNLRQEIAILSALDHENVVKMFDYFETEREFCVVTEFARGELFEILEEDGTLPEEAVRDIAFRMLPVTDEDARDMLNELRGKSILGKFRGAPPRDIDALVGAICGLSKIFAQHRKFLADLEVNPLIVGAEGEGVRAVDVRPVWR
mgnify:CR=1 FL=1